MASLFLTFPTHLFSVDEIIIEPTNAINVCAYEAHRYEKQSLVDYITKRRESIFFR